MSCRRHQLASPNALKTFTRRFCFSKQSSGEACKFVKKETLAQVFSCEFCEISKNTFFYRRPLVASPEIRNVTGQRIFNWFLHFICIGLITHLTVIKGTLSGLRVKLATETQLKMMKNAFYFILKALFVLKILKFLS